MRHAPFTKSKKRHLAISVKEASAMRKNFITGLAVLLPLLITYTIIAFLLKTIIGPFEKVIQGLISHLSFLSTEIAQQRQIAYFLSSLCIILGVLASIAL